VSRMSVRAFIALNFAGTLSAVIVLRLFARVLEGPIEAVLRFNDRNVKWLTAVSIALVVVVLVLQRVRGEGELEAVLDLESDLSDAGEDDDPPHP
jgi:membrane protein DedA with SNARE-associated domain